MATCAADEQNCGQSCVNATLVCCRGNGAGTGPWTCQQGQTCAATFGVCSQATTSSTTPVTTLTLIATTAQSVNSSTAGVGTTAVTIFVSASATATATTTNSPELTTGKDVNMGFVVLGILVAALAVFLTIVLVMHLKKRKRRPRKQRNVTTESRGALLKNTPETSTPPTNLPQPAQPAPLDIPRQSATLPRLSATIDSDAAAAIEPRASADNLEPQSPPPVLDTHTLPVPRYSHEQPSHHVDNHNSTAEDSTSTTVTPTPFGGAFGMTADDVKKDIVTAQTVMPLQNRPTSSTFGSSPTASENTAIRPLYIDPETNVVYMVAPLQMQPLARAPTMESAGQAEEPPPYSHV